MRANKELSIKFAATGVLALVVLGLTPFPSTAVVIAKSDFSFDDEGWRLSGDPTSPIPTYFSTGGNPGGFIRGIDATLNEPWYFNAPAKFLGDVSTAYNQPLTFDLRSRGSLQQPSFPSDNVILEGSSLSLFFDTEPTPTDPEWTSYSILLNEKAGWKVGSINGPTPTQAEFKDVLSDLTNLRILGEFQFGPDSGDLDNVVLNQVPEPLTILSSGLALGFGAYFKKEYSRKQKKAKAKP